MSVDDLRARILASRAQSIESDLLCQLDELEWVSSASATWFHGWVEIRVVLNEWTWEAQAEPNALIDSFAREHVREFSVTTRFVPTEPRPPRNALSAPSGDAKGERAHGDGTAAQGSAEANSGGKR